MDKFVRGGGLTSTNIVTPLHLVLDNTTFLHPCVNFVWADTGENLSPFPFMSSSLYNKSLHFSILLRLEICQKIYTTEDFRVTNLHRKRVIFDIC